MDALPLDQAIALKADQAFDLAALQTYLDAAAPSFGKIEMITKFPGGVASFILLNISGLPGNNRLSYINKGTTCVTT